MHAVVAYIAGFQAPPGRTMMGARGRSSPAAPGRPAKKTALEANGVRVGASPTEAARLAAEAFAALG
jgi:succinyl-CoA synthetase alpha subunit